MSLRVGCRSAFRVLRCTRAASVSSVSAQPADAPRILESPLGSATIPDETLPQFLWRCSSHLNQQPCITCGSTGRTLTYAEARAEAQRWAWVTRGSLGLRPGQCMALLLPNVPDFFTAVQGALLAGLRLTFANPLYTTNELQRQFQDANVAAVLTIPLLAEVAFDAAPEAQLILLDDGDQELDEGLPKGSLSSQKLLDQAQQTDLPSVDPSDIAILPYSSGTTGLPKGVMLSHRNLVANLTMLNFPAFKYTRSTTAMRELNSGLGFIEDRQDVALSVLPYFHIYGFNGILNAGVMHGLHLISMPRFTPDDYLACLKKYKPTALFVVPSLLQFLCAHPDVKPEMLASLRNVFSGAAPATQALLEKFRQLHGKHDLVVNQGYGMTESSPVTLMQEVTTPKEKELSVGRLLPGTQAQVVTPDGRAAGPGELGELLVRGQQVMLGYLGNEKATRETLDSDGWLHTGDVVYYDEEHYFYIVDRTKELIKVKGHQVSPTELENIIMEMPEVSDCAVVGIPDDRLDEAPRAFVVLHPNVKVTEKDIKKYIEPKVVTYKKLAGGVIFVDKIPRNPSGKILRQVLKKWPETE